MIDSVTVIGQNGTKRHGRIPFKIPKRMIQIKKTVGDRHVCKTTKLPPSPRPQTDLHEHQQPRNSPVRRAQFCCVGAIISPPEETHLKALHGLRSHKGEPGGNELRKVLSIKMPTVNSM